MICSHLSIQSTFKENEHFSAKVKLFYFLFWASNKLDERLEKQKLATHCPNIQDPDELAACLFTWLTSWTWNLEPWLGWASCKTLGFLFIAPNYGNKALLLTNYTHKMELLFALFDWCKNFSAIRNNSRRAHLDLSGMGFTLWRRMQALQAAPILYCYQGKEAKWFTFEKCPGRTSPSNVEFSSSLWSLVSHRCRVWIWNVLLMSLPFNCCGIRGFISLYKDLWKTLIYCSGVKESSRAAQYLSFHHYSSWNCPAAALWSVRKIYYA